MVPAGEAAIGFICVTFLGTGTDFPLIQEMRQYVYARGQGPGPEGDIGTDRWKRGVVDAVFVTEGIRTGHAPLRQPAPDGGAGAVGARTSRPHRRIAQGAGAGGPDLTAHPLVPRP